MACCLLSLMQAAAQSRPNIIVVLVDDMGYSDLADAMPEKTAELKAKLLAWLEETSAQMPVINPDFDSDNWQFRTSSRVDYQGNVIPWDVFEGQKK